MLDRGVPEELGDRRLHHLGLDPAFDPHLRRARENTVHGAVAHGALEVERRVDQIQTRRPAPWAGAECPGPDDRLRWGPTKPRVRRRSATAPPTLRGGASAPVYRRPARRRRVDALTCAGRSTLSAPSPVVSGVRTDPRCRRVATSAQWTPRFHAERRATLSAPDRQERVMSNGAARCRRPSPITGHDAGLPLRPTAAQQGPSLSRRSADRRGDRRRHAPGRHHAARLADARADRRALARRAAHPRSARAHRG